jgi:hypothetical protein
MGVSALGWVMSCYCIWEEFAVESVYVRLMRLLGVRLGVSVKGLNGLIGDFRAETFHNSRCIIILFNLSLTLA